MDQKVRKKERQGRNKTERITDYGKKTLGKEDPEIERRRYHPTLDFRFTKIAAKFLKGNFLISLIACLPLLIFEGWYGFSFKPEVTFELLSSDEYWWVSILSLLRTFMLFNTFKSLIMLCDMLSETYFHHRITIENAKNIGLNVLTSVLMLHFSACVWLAVHRQESHSEVVDIQLAELD